MDIDEIPEEQTDNFPMGVSEHSFKTMSEMSAFLEGVAIVDSLDCGTGDVFQRGDLYVVRVRVGEWGDDD